MCVTDGTGVRVCVTHFTCMCPHMHLYLATQPRENVWNQFVQFPSSDIRYEYLSCDKSSFVPNIALNSSCKVS